jgi:hypothetical protein
LTCGETITIYPAMSKLPFIASTTTATTRTGGPPGVGMR